MRNKKMTTMIVAMVVLIGGCEFSGPSRVTMGMAKIILKPGKTTQLTVLEHFGAPNITTRQDGQEVWVYDKVSSRESSSSFGIGGAGGGIGTGGAGGGVIAAGFGTSTRSETTVMLLIYFDENDIVRDYRVSQTKF